MGELTTAADVRNSNESPMIQPGNHYHVLWASDTSDAVKLLVTKARALGIATRLVKRLKELETLLQSQRTIFQQAAESTTRLRRLDIISVLPNFEKHKPRVLPSFHSGARRHNVLRHADTRCATHFHEL